MKAIEALRRKMAARKAWAELGTTQAYEPTPDVSDLADAILELADELQAVKRASAPIGGRTEALDASLRAGEIRLNSRGVLPTPGTLDEGYDPVLRQRAQEFADRTTAQAFAHVQQIKDAHAAARRHGWKSDDETLAAWVDRKCTSSYCADLLQKIQAKVGPKDNLVPFEKLPDSVAKLNLDSQSVAKYHDLLRQIQAIVSPESGPAPFDKLPDLAARVSYERQEFSDRCKENEELRTAYTQTADNLRGAEAALKANRDMCVLIESENSQLRAKVNPQPLKLYRVTTYPNTVEHVIAENADEAREQFFNHIRLSCVTEIQQIDMAKPGLLRR